MVVRSVLPLVLTLVCADLLPALTANDLNGTWKVDGEATWAVMKENPTMKAQLKPVPADQQELVKGMVMAQLGATTLKVVDGKCTILGLPGSTKPEEPKQWISTGPSTATLIVTAPPAAGKPAKDEPVQVEKRADGTLVMTTTAESPTPGTPGDTMSLIFKKQ